MFYITQFHFYFVILERLIAFLPNSDGVFSVFDGFKGVFAGGIGDCCFTRFDDCHCCAFDRFSVG